MVSELGDQDGIIFGFINDPVLVADPSGPVSGKIVFQGFRFPEAFILSVLLWIPSAFLRSSGFASGRRFHSVLHNPGGTARRRLHYFCG